MPRPVLGRRARLTLGVVCLVTAAATASGQTATPQRYSRLDRLEQWTLALEGHVPGEADGALRTFGTWSGREFLEFNVTFSSALALVRDPKIRTFLRPAPRGTRPSVQVFYSRGELNRLIAVADRLRAIGENPMLRRGAMLMMDTVVLVAGSDSRGEARRSDFFVYRFDDGQGLDQSDALGQWQTARLLLEQIRPDPRDFQPNPAGDDWVRRWYRTLVAYMLSQQHFNVGEATRGLELFPDDPETLFLQGVLHETLASPPIQEPFRSSDDLRRSVRIGSAGSELDTAERLLERAVKRSPDFAEARLHLGRVLAEQAHHQEALPELRRALSLIKNMDLRYFGYLFVGRSEAALGRIAEARDAFERANELRPSAQSPLLALSQLAYSGGDVAAAAAWLARAAEQSTLEGDDPWWIYNFAAGRFFGPSHEEIARDLRTEMRR